MKKIILLYFIIVQINYSQSFDYSKFNVGGSIIDRDILKELSVDELRILRNSIFANYGYKFRSVDLNTIFKDRGKVISGAIQLNFYEQSNLENILEIEDSTGLKITNVWKNDIGFDNGIAKVNVNQNSNDEIIFFNKNNNEFSLFSLEDNQWNCKEKIITPNKPRSWTVADLNGDKIDEIYFTNYDTILTKDKDKVEFDKFMIHPSEEIWKILSGDINNDNIIELLVFSFVEEYDYDKPSIPVRLGIYQNIDDRLHLIAEFNDKKHLSYSNVMPSYKVLFIDNIFNEKLNHLYIKSPQSDPSPSRYISYYLDKNELKEGTKFTFTGDTLYTMPFKWKERIPHLLGKLDNMDFYNYQFGGIVLSSWESDNCDYSIFKFENGIYSKRIKLVSGNFITGEELVVLTGKFHNNINSILLINKNWIKMIEWKSS